jgi:hypothetical protein
MWKELESWSQPTSERQRVRRRPVLVLLAAVAAIGTGAVLGESGYPRIWRRWLSGRCRGGRMSAGQAAMELAAQRGLPVQASEVRVEQRPTGTRVEVRYQKNVDLFVYSVRLHMRAKSGS